MLAKSWGVLLQASIWYMIYKLQWPDGEGIQTNFILCSSWTNYEPIHCKVTVKFSEILFFLSGLSFVYSYSLLILKYIDFFVNVYDHFDIT